ncbi:MAG: class I mannose-6-phosphate isomerase, partial [Verrucomicrobiae bacterium]|nr:class I mannose-6-phosphate isomerase [Verrucomicrobiae bacterium]
MLYPLIFHPIFKEHPWGGRNLERLYHKPLPPNMLIGESWEISDRDEGCSVVANGPLAGRNLQWLVQHHKDELLGLAQTRSGRFPLLAKILDAAQSPSVQVHPSVEVASRLAGEPKSELWYVTYAEPDAQLFVGLRHGVRRLQFERKISEGGVIECLHTLPVKAGDAVFIPAGRIHTIGAGTVLFEIQENSDTTYRVYDWDRPGPDGRPRPLHIEQALEAIDFEDFEPDLIAADFTEQPNVRTRILVNNELFLIEERQASVGFFASFSDANRPSIVAVVSGLVRVQHPSSGTDFTLGAGRFCLIPASAADTTLSAQESSVLLVAQPGIGGRVGSRAESLSERDAVPPWEVYESRRRMQAELAGPPRKWSWERVKRRLARNLIYSPFLRMLVLKFWFRVAVLSLVAILAALAVLLPPVWRTSPPGFTPIIRISLLDKIQAKMLQKTAERAAAAGNYRAAADAWRAAFANN